MTIGLGLLITITFLGLGIQKKTSSAFGLPWKGGKGTQRPIQVVVFYYEYAVHNHMKL